MSQAIVSSTASSSSSSISFCRGENGEEMWVKTIHAYLRKNPIDLSMIQFLVEENERMTSEITDAVAPCLLPALALIVTSYVRQRVLSLKTITLGYILDRLHTAACHRQAFASRIEKSDDICAVAQYCLDNKAVTGYRIKCGIADVEHLEGLIKKEMDSSNRSEYNLRTWRQQLKEPAARMVQEIVMPHLKKHPEQVGDESYAIKMTVFIGEI